MRVSMDASDVGMSLGNNGIVLYIKDNRGRHVGKLRIGQAQVEARDGLASATARRCSSIGSSATSSTACSSPGAADPFRGSINWVLTRDP